MDDIEVKTDFLIAGAGPAGASLACFLASYGLTGVMIAAAPGSANTPRAHIFNMAGLECLRDIGLEESCLRAATKGENMIHTRWCHSMAGEEYARTYAFGNDPQRKGAYEAASPCNHVDLPQTEMEPILLRRAVHEGWILRFSTVLLSFTQPSPEVVVSEVRDKVTQKVYKIQSRFLFGCDGGRSAVVDQLKIPLIKKQDQGLAINIVLKADLSHLMTNRVGSLHWTFQPEKEHPEWGWTVLARMVRPWNEWLFTALPAPGSKVTKDPSVPREAYLKRVKEAIGDDSIDVEILDISHWTINDVVAEYYSDGNVFCLGDAVHRHPPINGLGSNTCLQDAFNLAWKVAYVVSGRAGSELLRSYSAERQPVGANVVERANAGFRDHQPWMMATGLLEPDLQKRKAVFAELDDPGKLGQQKRKMLQEAIDGTATEFHGLGIEMSQGYSSGAIYSKDESIAPKVPEHPITTHVVSTFPGYRLPHAWLNTRIPGKPFSTIDLAGHGNFCLLTGPTGKDWIAAASIVSKTLGITIRAYSIGWKQDYEDVYSDWAKRREVEEDGCVLARPDRFVAWRSKDMVSDATGKLEEVMKTVLSQGSKVAAR